MDYMSLPSLSARAVALRIGLASLGLTLALLALPLFVAPLL
jgi:hypothetical protein